MYIKYYMNGTVYDIGNVSTDILFVLITLKYPVPIKKCTRFCF